MNSIYACSPAHHCAQALELGPFGGGEDELDDRAVLEGMLLQLAEALGASCGQLRSLRITELDYTDFDLPFDLPAVGHPFFGGNRLRYSARSGCEWLAALASLEQLQVGTTRSAAAHLAGRRRCEEQ
jgi:hypothetical protein